MKKSGLSKLKQRTAEWFNKNKRTEDISFEEKKKQVNNEVILMRSLWENVTEIFASNQQLMEQTEQMGEVLKLMYSDQPAYTTWISNIA